MKLAIYSLLALILIVPELALAQKTLQNVAISIPLFLFNVLVPFLFGIAFLVFVVNAIRYFVIESKDEAGREKARKLATYGILAFVFLVIFFGVVRLVAGTIGVGVGPPPCPDYICDNGGGAGFSNQGNNNPPIPRPKPENPNPTIPIPGNKPTP